MSDMVFTLPWPPKQLMPNFKRRKHWSVYAPITKTYRLACKGLTKSAHVAIEAGNVPVLMTITFHPPDRRRRDRDGAISAFKAGQDGIADALGVDDHWFRPTHRFGDPVKGGAVVIEFEPETARPIGEIIKPIVAGIISKRMGEAA